MTPALDEGVIHARFARTALSLYGERGEFEIAVPEGLDEVEIASAFRAAGCEITTLTARRSVIVVP